MSDEREAGLAGSIKRGEDLLSTVRSCPACARKDAALRVLMQRVKAAHSELDSFVPAPEDVPDNENWDSPQWVLNELEDALEQAGAALAEAAPAAAGEPAGTCTACDGPVFHRPGLPGEYDHECPAAPEPERDLRQRILAMMQKRGWSTHWIHRSAYLHLEAAELAEAVRGKRGDTLDESADVLITLLALSPHDLDAIISAAEGKLARLQTAPPYPGEDPAPEPQRERCSECGKPWPCPGSKSLNSASHCRMAEPQREEAQDTRCPSIRDGCRCTQVAGHAGQHTALREWPQREEE